MAQEEQWRALAELTRMTGLEQRRVLRMHQEVGFDAEGESEAILLRLHLDDELQIILLRELWAQTDPARVRDTFSDIPAFATLLRESPAFAQYLNFYYYFGVRFAAGRIANPCLPVDEDRHFPRLAADCNERMVGLPSPPLCAGVWNGQREFARFIAHLISAQPLDPAVTTALAFLDDYVVFDQSGPEIQQSHRGDEHAGFELWLRGFNTDNLAAPANFRFLAAGLLKWAENRCNFYISLEESDEKRESLANWKESKWREGRFHVNNPLAARCALADFYWLARLLRADVTPRGRVSYGGHSWLRLMALKPDPLAASQEELTNLLGPPRWNLELVQSVQDLLQDAAAQDVIRDDTVRQLIMTLDRRRSNPPSDMELQQWKRMLRLINASVGNDEALQREVAEILLGKAYQSFSLQITNQDNPSVEEQIPERPLMLEILRMEEVLRGVFAYACDLIQNAIEVAEDCEDRNRNPADYRDRPASTKSWRAVYDLELREIMDQRREWRTDTILSGGPGGASKCEETAETPGWSRRIWTGEHAANLVGLAFSGGGIRSATFNLGVLQQLQELDLLRYVDYLSTVSGGGYIGAWLVGNVRRTRYWLSRMTSWDKSIEHLRRYSNYLAPRNGLLSADTWSMWGTWIRNAFLIQLTGFSWLAFLLVALLALYPLFIGLGDWINTAQDGLNGLLALIGIIVSFYLWQLSKPYVPPKPGSLERLRIWTLGKGNAFARAAALLAWIGCFIASGLLWHQATKAPKKYEAYWDTLLNAPSEWHQGLTPVFLIALLLLSFSSFIPKSRSGRLARVFWPSVITLATAAACYLAVCAQLRLFGAMAAGSQDPVWSWIAFTTGPALTLAAVTVGIVFYIGLLGRDSAEWSREWWTRYGSWIAMYGAAGTAATAAAVFAPIVLHALFHLSQGWLAAIKFGTVAGWVGSVVSGLLAGKSSRTGRGARSSNLLEWVARAGGFLFAVGAVAIVATVVFNLLGLIVLPAFKPSYWQNLADIVQWSPDNYKFWVILPSLLCISLLFSQRFDLNTFGLNQFYRNRLVRCYLGATRWQSGKRHPHRFTAFDPADDIDLACLTVKNTQFCGESFRGPLPIINCTLNLGGSSDLALHTRQSAAFTVTPLHCGSDRRKVGYAPTPQYAGRVTLGQAISISGAAASPNMGYNTSPLVSLLLTMFNVRLGWWFPNPGDSACEHNGSLSAAYLVRELFGTADDRMPFVNVSDGGHFENLGIYELVRRKTRVIIAGDAECDEEMTFGSLGRLIRICETDFGARIDLDVGSLKKQDSGLSRAHCAVGKITYANGSIGYLIYLKSSLTGDEDIGIAQYKASHSTFPHESTADQFFTEDQFEAYRRLGHHITGNTFCAAENEPLELFGIAGKLFDVWAPAPFSTDAFLDSVKAFDQIWDRFRQDPGLAQLFAELTRTGPIVPSPLTAAEICVCMELLQLMENVFLELRLDDFWHHPDNRGWAMVFARWAQSPKFRQVWESARPTYGIRFEYFCNRYLGLKRDRPVVRV
jgi:hypothetical protein